MPRATGAGHDRGGRDGVARRTQPRHGRRRILCLVVLGAKEEDHGRARVHGKALVLDDRLVRVGSANLSNRSMSVDTECDLAIEAENEATRAGSAAFRDRLAGERPGAFSSAVLGMTPGIVWMSGLGVDEEHQ